MIPKFLSCAIFLTMPVIATATEYRMVERPRQQCWNEQVAVRSSGSGYGGAVIGGIAGGLLGNRIGKGNGRAVATAIGAATVTMKIMAVAVTTTMMINFYNSNPIQPDVSGLSPRNRIFSI